MPVAIGSPVPGEAPRRLHGRAGDARAGEAWDAAAAPALGDQVATADHVDPYETASSRAVAGTARPGTTSARGSRTAGGPSAAVQSRGAIRQGARVAVVQKEHQPTGQLTEGTVAQLLTSSQNHPRGVKVRLTSGLVGRVQQVLGN